MRQASSAHHAATTRAATQAGPGPRLVVLTYPCRTAALLLDRLWRSGFHVSAVVLERKGTVRKLRRLRRVVGWRGALALGVRRLAASAGLRQSEEWRSDALYRRYADEVAVVPDLNGDQCVDVLRRVQPDVAVIGEAGMLCDRVYSTPRFGTLNMHPGLLPEYRGLSSIVWAVCAGDDVGGTLHFVDEGLDTGPVVSRCIVPVEPGDTCVTLAERVLEQNLRMLQDALRVLSAGGRITAVPQPEGAGRTYHAAPVAVKRLAGRLLSGRAAPTERKRRCCFRHKGG